MDPLHTRAATAFSVAIFLSIPLVRFREQFSALLIAGGSGRAGEWYIIPRSCEWRTQFLHRENRIFYETSFKISFHLSPNTVEMLLNILGQHIAGTPTNFRMPVPTRHRLLIYLYYVAQGMSYQALSNQFAYGRSTISRIIYLVSSKIKDIITPEYVRWPNAQERARIVQQTLQQSGMPNCVGYIDGTHLAIARPVRNGSDYFNRKSYYSINVLGKDNLHWQSRAWPILSL